MWKTFKNSISISLSSISTLHIGFLLSRIGLNIIPVTSGNKQLILCVSNVAHCYGTCPIALTSYINMCDNS